jgi:hypothetical protein
MPAAITAESGDICARFLVPSLGAMSSMTSALSPHRLKPDRKTAASLPPAFISERANNLKR